MERQKASKAAQSLFNQNLNTIPAAIQPSGSSTLSAEHQAWRVAVVRDWMTAGIPLNALQRVRHLIEKNNYSLCNDRGSRDMIPAILELERNTVRSEIVGCAVSVCFDCTPHHSEVFVAMLRFVDAAWKIQQRVGDLQLLAQCLDAKHLAGLLAKSLASLSISPENVFAFSHDGCTVNSAAMDKFGDRVEYEKAESLRCISHALSNVGKKFNGATLQKFFQSYTAATAHSFKAKALFKDVCGQAAPQGHRIRWQADCEAMKGLLVNFDAIDVWISDCEEANVAEASMKQMKAIMEDPAMRAECSLELTMVASVGKRITSAVFLLEGDGFLAPLVHNILERLGGMLLQIKSYIDTNRSLCPLLQELDDMVAKEPHFIEDVNLLEIQKSTLNPLLKYFFDHFDANTGILRKEVRRFRALLIFNIIDVHILGNHVDFIEKLCEMEFFRVARADLLNELPTYLRLVEVWRGGLPAAGVDASSVNLLAWFKDRQSQLPHFSKCAKIAALLQPSSAMAERAFSTMRALFDEQQTAALGDYRCASTMLSYNTNWRS